MNVDILIIGGGASGLAAAIGAYDDDLNVLLIERDGQLGGILNQCIHNGFGLHMFKEELTGPEYAWRYIETFKEKGIPHLLNTTVLDIEPNNNAFNVTVSNNTDGVIYINAKSVILSTGCYERTRGQIQLPGHRPKGIMPAGSAQRYLNMDGYLVGKDVFILGSGDIGLIMARRMVLEGANVLGVAEIMPHSNGLNRNIAQCLEDYDIPLFLSHTVTDILGKDSLEGIVISQVDENFRPIKGTEKHFTVDTLLLSVGLIPDIALFDSLSFDVDQKTKSAIVNQHYMTSVPGLFACGNALHVHDLADYVSEESKKAGSCAKAYVQREKAKNEQNIKLQAGNAIGYVLPQLIDVNHFDESIEIFFRVTKKAEKGKLLLKQDNTILKTKNARHIVPAEMEKIALSKSDLINLTTPITLVFEEDSL